eukprot:snap_masked-scaffold_9-processed-gene-1.27-mRNA-1 protein AED:1.00 eAED:1.00 QI:0/-1/0/0/-1/1/1/0/337
MHRTTKTAHSETKSRYITSLESADGAVVVFQSKNPERNKFLERVLREKDLSKPISLRLMNFQRMVSQYDLNLLRSAFSRVTVKRIYFGEAFVDKVSLTEIFSTLVKSISALDFFQFDRPTFMSNSEQAQLILLFLSHGKPLKNLALQRVSLENCGMKLKNYFETMGSELETVSLEFGPGLMYLSRSLVDLVSLSKLRKLSLNVSETALDGINFTLLYLIQSRLLDSLKEFSLIHSAKTFWSDSFVYPLIKFLSDINSMTKIYLETNVECLSAASMINSILLEKVSFMEKGSSISFLPWYRRSLDSAKNLQLKLKLMNKLMVYVSRTFSVNHDNQLFL